MWHISTKCDEPSCAFNRVSSVRLHAHTLEIAWRAAAWPSHLPRKCSLEKSTDLMKQGISRTPLNLIKPAHHGRGEASAGAPAHFWGSEPKKRLPPYPGLLNPSLVRLKACLFNELFLSKQLERERTCRILPRTTLSHPRKGVRHTGGVHGLRGKLWLIGPPLAEFSGDADAHAATATAQTVQGCAHRRAFPCVVPAISRQRGRERRR